MSKSIKAVVIFFVSAFVSIVVAYFGSLFVISPVLDELSILINGCDVVIKTTRISDGSLINSNCAAQVPQSLAMLIFVLFLLSVFLVIHKFLEKRIK